MQDLVNTVKEARVKGEINIVDDPFDPLSPAEQVLAGLANWAGESVIGLATVILRRMNAAGHNGVQSVALQHSHKVAFHAGNLMLSASVMDRVGVAKNLADMIYSAIDCGLAFDLPVAEIVAERINGGCELSRTKAAEIMAMGAQQ